MVVYIVLHIIRKGSRLINFFRGEMAAVARFALRVWDLGQGLAKVEENRAVMEELLAQFGRHEPAVY